MPYVGPEMSPRYQVDSVTEMNGSYEKFEIGF